MNKSSISSSDLKKLREITGAGFLDCKEALESSDANIEKAIDFLRKKGISTAKKKGERSAKEGLIAISKNSTSTEASIIEVNSETDFVARNEDFQNFTSNISNINLNQKGNLENLMNSKYVNSNDKVSDELTNLISKIGENLTIRRAKYITIDGGLIGTYVHNIEKDNMGKIGVLVSIKTDIENSQLDDFLKKISMHIAAANPISVNEKNIDQDIISKEKNFYLEEIKKSGKEKNIQDKMLEGKMKKFYADVVLLEQNFVIDDKIKIKEFVENTSKELNGSINIIEFTRFKVGEEI